MSAPLKDNAFTRAKRERAREIGRRMERALGSRKAMREALNLCDTSVTRLMGEFPVGPVILGRLFEWDEKNPEK